jgi:hypothetical protein
MYSVSVKPTFNWFSEMLFLSWNISQTLDFFSPPFRLWSEILCTVTAVGKFLSDIFTAILNVQRNFWQWFRNMYFRSLTPWWTYYCGVCVRRGWRQLLQFRTSVFYKGRVLICPLGSDIVLRNLPTSQRRLLFPSSG